MKEYTDSLTVAELIQELQQLHQSYRVCVRGCDGIGVYDITQIIPDERGFIEICTLNSEQHIVPCECGHGKDQHNSLDSRPFGKWNCTYCRCVEYDAVTDEPFSGGLGDEATQRAWMRYADEQEVPHDHEDEEAFKYGFDAGRNQDSPRVCECGHLEKEHDLYDAVTRERMDCLVGVFKGMEINAQICPCSKFRLQGRVKHENA